MGRPPHVSDKESLAVRYDLHVLGSNQFRSRLSARGFLSCLSRACICKFHNGQSCRTIFDSFDSQEQHRKPVEKRFMR